jgi:hypothetical protein
MNNSRYEQRESYGQSYGGHQGDGASPSVPNANQNGRNHAHGAVNQQPEDMIVDRIPDEAKKQSSGDEESRPDSPQSTVDESKAPFAEKEYKEQLIAQVRLEIKRELLIFVISNDCENTFSNLT